MRTRLMRTVALAALLAAFVMPQGMAQTGHAAAERLAARGGLPVLSIVTATGALPADEDGAGSMRLILPDGYAATVQIEIRERGNTSRRFPKKSYRVKIVNERGDKRNFSIAGLRSDDDWILNPLYADTSKIREALAYSLWEDVNSAGSAAASSRARHAEVFLNGEYWGLYCVQERIDRKQVQGDKRTGVLYKVAANVRPAVQELLDCRDDEVCRGLELAFAGAAVQQPWLPAAAYMACLNGEISPYPAALSQANVIDYGLWAMLTQAHDCHYKNQFVHCVMGEGGYTLYKIPWDLNNTFGDIWQNEDKAANYTGYRVGKLVMDSAFKLLLETGGAQAAQAVQARWRALREGVITQDALLARARALWTPLFEAIERDTQRWPSCGMGEGNARNIRDIEQFICDILPRMDSFVAALDGGQ